MKSFSEFRLETPNGYGCTSTDETVKFFPAGQTEDEIKAFQPLAAEIKEAAEAEGHDVMTHETSRSSAGIDLIVVTLR